MTHPIIAITPGEPAGIGPDLAIITAQKKHGARLVYFADPVLLINRANDLNINIMVNTLSSLKNIPESQENVLNVWPVKTACPVVSGQLNAENAPYVLDCIRLAVESQLNNKTHALMTGPIHKGIINDAGISFSGHTEYLARLSSGTPVMMLAAEAEKLRVALVTTHLPLSQVSPAITQEKLQHIISILHHDLQSKYGIQHPHILICGLNPHAGESGHMGMEEIEIISPVPADTLFTPKYLENADAVLAMYHDQGLPVLKHVGFGHAINITLGLSIIRTSVDHGTALELAATTNISTGSYLAALKTAIQLANNQRLAAKI